MDLIDAAENNDIQRVRELLDSGADINFKDRYGFTALIRATAEGHTEMVRLLLDYGADINYQNRNGLIALIIASASGYTEIVRLLLEKGADPTIRNNISGMTALDQALIHGHTDIVELLESYNKEDEPLDEPPDEPDRDLQKYESARNIQRRFRGNRQRRQLTKKAHRYGKMYGPATRKETMRRWIDLSKQFDGDDIVGYLDPFSKKGGKKKPKKTKRKHKKSKRKSKKPKSKKKK